MEGPFLLVLRHRELGLQRNGICLPGVVVRIFAVFAGEGGRLAVGVSFTFQRMVSPMACESHLRGCAFLPGSVEANGYHSVIQPFGKSTLTDA